MKILVTGGLGYIGSHTCVELLNAGHEIVIVDNLSNSKADVEDKIKKITGKDFIVYHEDVCDKQAVNTIFETHRFDAVIHFAGYKVLGESIHKALEYYSNNLQSTLSLLEVMKNHGCKKMVFSSSASVYGKPERIPVDEKCQLGPVTNPYANTKLLIEQILKDVYVSDSEWNVAILRYFNPIGAHESGLIGEEPNGIPNNLMPYIVKVANKELDVLHVFGNDYDTPDGTGVRDYIHVVDLAKGHLAALNKLDKMHIGVEAYNLGTGKGCSVLDLVTAFEKVNSISLPYVIDPRREGDVAVCYADTKKANEELGWSANKGIEEMCRDSWNYILKNKK